MHTPHPKQLLLSYTLPQSLIWLDHHDKFARVWEGSQCHSSTAEALVGVREPPEIFGAYAS
jgi:hypothetical protein